jgi:hypothetical protein
MLEAPQAGSDHITILASQLLLEDKSHIQRVMIVDNYKRDMEHDWWLLVPPELHCDPMLIG